MSNITITGGHEVPWEIEGTDTAAPQDIILKNLATAKLAYLGSQAGMQINAQKEVLQKVVDGADLLSDRLDEFSAPLPWNTNFLDLNINDQIGLVPGDQGFDGAKLVKADTLAKEAGLSGFSQNYFFYKNPSTNNLVYGKLSEIYKVERPLNLTIESYSSVPFGSVVFSSSDQKYYYYLRVGALNYTDLIPDGIKTFGIPSSENEIIRLTSGSEFSKAINYIATKLLKKDLIYGSDISAEDQILLDDPATSENIKNEIKNKYQSNIYSDIKVDFDRVKVNIPNVTAGDEYFYIPVKSFTPEEAKSLKSGALFSLRSDLSQSKKYYYSTGSGMSIEVNASTQMKFFILKPNAEEIQNWRSQVAEKQIQLTQRSSELQNFLNELIQTYNYTFDAATNIFKLLAGADSEIIKNI